MWEQSLTDDADAARNAEMPLLTHNEEQDVFLPHMSIFQHPAPSVANGVVLTRTETRNMSTKNLGVTRRRLSGRSPLQMVGSEGAAWLINVFYTNIYGPMIQSESPRSMRIRITDLTIQLRTLQRGSYAYRLLGQQIAQFERIGQLLEMMPLR